eukprot:scaffold74866_cov48-Phaeocystis_antarctica.AAC.1
MPPRAALPPPQPSSRSPAASSKVRPCALCAPASVPAAVWLNRKSGSWFPGTKETGRWRRRRYGRVARGAVRVGSGVACAAGRVCAAARGADLARRRRGDQMPRAPPACAWPASRRRAGRQCSVCRAWSSGRRERAPRRSATRRLVRVRVRVRARARVRIEVGIGVGARVR